MGYVFDSVEVYRHTSDLTSATRDWCVANTTLVYSGSDELFSDTGLAAETHYYYKMFAKYYDSETASYKYSDGVVTDTTTQASQAASGTNITLLQSYTTISNAGYCAMCKIDDTHFAAAYRDASTYHGVLKTFSVNGSFVVTEIDSIEFSASTSNTGNALLLLDSTHLALISTPGDYSVTYIYSIDANADNLALVDSLELTDDYATRNAILKIDDTHYVVAYGVYAAIISVDGGYNLSKVSSLNCAGTYDKEMVLLDSSHIVVVSEGGGNDGFIRVVGFNGSYALSVTTTALEFDTYDGRNPSAVKIDDHHVIATYQSNGSKVSTFGFDATTYAITEITNGASIGVGSGYYNSMVCIADGIFINAAQNTTGGETRICSISVNESYSVSVVETKTLSSRIYNKLILLDSKHLVLFNSGGIFTFSFE